ncbi:hypothetical protein AB1Y20_013426 [Prymnesium parvum]|uniref:PH domain-containing protein n=1 Tax=Prymnesium parvum TaxID=97485 RepID=A0AB34IFK5_PRYPA
MPHPSPPCPLLPHSVSPRPAAPPSPPSSPPSTPRPPSPPPDPIARPAAVNAALLSTLAPAPPPKRLSLTGAAAISADTPPKRLSLAGGAAATSADTPPKRLSLAGGAAKRGSLGADAPPPLSAAAGSQRSLLAAEPPPHRASSALRADSRDSVASAASDAPPPRVQSLPRLSGAKGRSAREIVRESESLLLSHRESAALCRGASDGVAAEEAGGGVGARVEAQGGAGDEAARGVGEGEGGEGGEGGGVVRLSELPTIHGSDRSSELSSDSDRPESLVEDAEGGSWQPTAAFEAHAPTDEASESTDLDIIDRTNCAAILEQMPFLNEADRGHVRSLIQKAAAAEHQVLRGSGGVGGSGSVREGEVELVLPDKGSLYLKDGRLALEFYQSEAVITRVDPDAPTLRACCFVGDVVLAVNGAPIDTVATLHKLLQAHTSGEPPAVQRALRAIHEPRVGARENEWHERVRFCAWVEICPPQGVKAGPEKSSGGKTGKKNLLQTGGMGVLVVGAQRVRVLQLALVGTRQGVLFPTLVGHLRKQGAPGQFSRSKWTRRRFELLGGSLFYYEPDGKLKGEIHINEPTVQVLDDPSWTQLAEPHSFVISTRKRSWALQATDERTKAQWVDTLRQHVGKPCEPLLLLEDVSCTIVLDEHVLSLHAIKSTDGLKGQLSFSFGGSALHVSTPSVSEAALQFCAAWQHLAVFLGAPIDGSRHDSWLQPHADGAHFALRPYHLRWRPSSPAAAADGTFVETAGELTLKLAADASTPWGKCSSLRRRHCLLRPSIREASVYEIAIFETDAALQLSRSLHRHAEAPAYPVHGANAAIELPRVRAVRPAADATAPPHAVELLLAEPDGVLTLEAAGWEEADVWAEAMRRVLPASCFVPPAAGSLEWVDGGGEGGGRRRTHPSSWMGCGQELACALLTMGDYQRVGRCEAAAVHLIAAVDADAAGGPALCLEQRRGHCWAEAELELLFAALTHNTRVVAVRLLKFALGGQAARAVTELLRHNASLRRLEMIDCSFSEGVPKFWAEAVASNPHMPLAALVIRSTLAKPKAEVSAAIGAMLSAWPTALEELVLSGVGAGVKAGVIDALTRHSTRLLHLRSLKSLGLSMDTTDERTFMALSSLVKRAVNLTSLDVHPASKWRPLNLKADHRCLALVLASARSKPSLQHLALDGFNLSIPDTVSALHLMRISKECVALHTLSLEGTHISADALSAVVGLLVHNASRAPVDLNLSRNNLGPVGAYKLATVLAGAVALRGLNLSDNQIGAEALISILAELKGLRPLQRLGVGKNIAMPKGAEQIQTIKEPLPHEDPPSLSSLPDPSEDAGSLSDPQPSSGPMSAVTPSASEAPPARHRGDDFDADMGRRAISALCDLISHPDCSLESIDASGSPDWAAPTELARLISALPQCASITSADLSGHGACPVPADVVQAVVETIRASRALNTLQLQRNGLGLQAFGQALAAWEHHSATLEACHFYSYDPRQPDGLAALAAEGVSASLVPQLSELLAKANVLSARNRRLSAAIQLLPREGTPSSPVNPTNDTCS